MSSQIASWSVRRPTANDNRAAGNRGSGPVPESAQSHDLLAAHIARAESRLREVAASVDASLTQIALHLIDAGGKRLRPALAVSSAIAAGGAEAVTPLVIDAAAAVELLHLATLYHDDVIDSASARRGRPSVNAVWGNKAAILAGDVLLALAFRLAAGLGPAGLGRFSRTVTDLCSGEMAEAEMQFDPQRRVADYEASVRDKTAALFASSCRLGASAAGAPEPMIQALDRYGSELGVAFQVVDDVMDLCADGGLTGKGSGSDLRGGVFTLPVLLSLTPDPGLRELLTEGIDEDGIEEVRRRVRRVGGDRLALEAAVGRVESAVACLSGESFDPYGRRLLVSIAESVFEPVERLGLQPSQSGPMNSSGRDERVPCT